MKIKDRIIVGSSSALLAAIFGRLVNGFQYRQGWTDEKYNQTASSLMLPDRMAKKGSVESKVVGSLVNNTMVATSGAMITYLLSATGRDKAVLKGAGFGAFSWVAIWGLTNRLGVKVRTKKPMTHILSLVDHIVFGANTAWLITKFGDASLFPDAADVAGAEKLPLAGSAPKHLPRNNYLYEPGKRDEIT